MQMRLHREFCSLQSAQLGTHTGQLHGRKAPSFPRLPGKVPFEATLGNEPLIDLNSNLLSSPWSSQDRNAVSIQPRPP